MNRICCVKAGAFGAAAGISALFCPLVPEAFGEEEMKVFSEPVYEKTELTEPQLQMQGPSGEIYNRISWEIEEVEERSREEKVKETAVFHGLESENEIQGTIIIQRTDPRTGEIVTAEGRKEEVQTIGEHWVEEEEVPLICYLSSDRKDSLEGEAVMYDDVWPPELACLTLASEMGLSGENYEIEDICWDGQVFQDEEGNLCRMIRMEGKKLVKDYQVVYEGTMVYPETVSYRTCAIYGPVREELSEEKKTEEEKAEETAAVTEAETEAETKEEHEDETQSKGKGKIWSLIRERRGITISLGACLIMGAVLWKGAGWVFKKKK